MLAWLRVERAHLYVSDGDTKVEGQKVPSQTRVYFERQILHVGADTEELMYVCKMESESLLSKSKTAWSHLRFKVHGALFASENQQLTRRNDKSAQKLLLRPTTTVRPNRPHYTDRCYTQ